MFLLLLASVLDTMCELDIVKHEEVIKIYIAADGFLYNMVRIIVGTLIKIGRGTYPPQRMKDILEGCDRSLAGPTAPAIGLTLMHIDYPCLNGEEMLKDV